MFFPRIFHNVNVAARTYGCTCNYSYLMVVHATNYSLGCQHVRDLTILQKAHSVGGRPLYWGWGIGGGVGGV
jgi:hypothetical protein